MILRRFRYEGNEYNTEHTGDVYFLDSLVVDSKTYKDVLVLSYGLDKTDDFYKTSYWVRDVGLIKYVDQNDIVGILTRFEVSK